MMHMTKPGTLRKSEGGVTPLNAHRHQADKSFIPKFKGVNFLDISLKLLWAKISLREKGRRLSLLSFFK